MRRIFVGILVFVAGLVMLTNDAWLERQLERKIERDVFAPDRFVDIGVTIRVVEQHPDGKQMIRDMPRMRTVGEPRHLGGIVDTRADRPCIVGPSQRWDNGVRRAGAPPRVWLASTAQAAIVLYNLPVMEASVMGQLVYGSEGGGKTRALAMWHYTRWLMHIGDGREGGQTAPTETRLEAVYREMVTLFDPSWYEFKVSDLQFEMCDRTRIRMVSTHRRSKAQGSPLQSFNWSWCGRDEGQDQVDVHEDIVNRGRSARRGGEEYHQLITATAKDDTEWRTLRDLLVTSGRWAKQSLSIYFSPFVTARSIADKIATMDRREVLRRYGKPDGTLDDLPPELAVFHGWDRKRNLVRKPQIAVDVTAAVLAHYSSYIRLGARFALACGHDPGIIYNTTIVSKLLMFGGTPTWTVVGELRTEQTTPKAHAIQLKEYLQRTFGVELGGTKAAIFVDPHGKGDADTDYQTHYMAMQGVGLDAFSPAPMTQRISRGARVHMINRLLMPAEAVIEDGRIVLLAAGEPRLVVATDEQGQPLAPHLVRSFETMRKRAGERDPEGLVRKDATDPTHPPAALGYLLWPFEQEAITEDTVRRAIAEARRYQ